MSWKHVEDFFNLDKRSAIRMAPKLTERHIHLPPFSNMRVKLDTQVFSHSVAAGTKCIYLNLVQNSKWSIHVGCCNGNQEGALW